MGIIFGLVASVLHGVGYLFLKKATNQFSASVSYAFYAIFGIIFWLPFSLLIGVETENLVEVFAYTLLSSILSEAFVYFVLSKGDISIASGVFSAYPVFTILISVLIFGERLQMPVALFVLITIVGIVVIALPKSLKKDELEKINLVVWPILGAIAVGISDSMSKSIMVKTSYASFLFCLSFSQIPVALLFLKLEKQKLSTVTNVLKNVKRYKFLLIQSILITLSLVFLWLSFNSTLASIASPLTATYMVFVLPLARIFLKEKIRKKDIVGIVLTSIGVVGVSVFY